MSRAKIPIGYKQTEIGVIPEEWEVKRLDEIFSITAGRDLIKDAFSQISGDSHPHPIYSNSLENKGLYGYSRVYRHKENCVTVTARGTIGVANSRYHKFDAIGRLLVMSPILETNCFFMSEYINHRVKFSIESTGVPQLTAPQISKYSVAYPKHEEQATIASILCDVDNLISSLENLIAKKRAIKQGAMQELLTGKRRLPGFSGKWEMNRLGDLLDYERPDKYIVKDTEYVEKGQIPVLTANKSFILGYTNEDFGIYNKIPVIIFDDFTTDSKYVDFSFKVKSSAIKILKSENDSTNLKYLYERMKLIDFPLGDHKRYYISEYQNIVIPIPKPDEQFVIAQAINDFDSDIVALEQKLTKYRLVKQGMMQVLLTGKVRLV